MDETTHKKLRNDFPILRQKIHGKDLAFLDSAASAQKPKTVIDAMSRFYENDYANIHRGLYDLSQRATMAYESARENCSRFIHANSSNEIVFVRGATEGINLVAHSFVSPRLQSGDEIILSQMEHHANIVPWQLLRDEKNISLKVIPINRTGELDLEAYEKLFSPRTKFVSVVHVSNALGTINPAKKLVEIAHRQNVPILLDGAQAVPHFRVNMKDLDCDFYVFSGHKVFGPTGIGVLYGKEKLLSNMRPYQGGGEMITSVSFEKTDYAQSPHRFEAGTPNIVGTIGLSSALEYVESLDRDDVEKYESILLEYATHRLQEVKGVRIIGTSEHKVPVVSFTVEDYHPQDIGMILDQEGIAVRIGHHCTQPLMNFFGIPSTLRASLSFYNDKSDIDRLVEALNKAIAFLR